MFRRKLNKFAGIYLLVKSYDRAGSGTGSGQKYAKYYIRTTKEIFIFPNNVSDRIDSQ